MEIAIHFMVPSETGLLSSLPQGNAVEMMQTFGLGSTAGKRYGAACGAPVGTNDGTVQHMGSGEADFATCTACKETAAWGAKVRETQQSQRVV